LHNCRPDITIRKYNKYSFLTMPKMVLGTIRYSFRHVHGPFTFTLGKNWNIALTNGTYALPPIAVLLSHLSEYPKLYHQYILAIIVFRNVFFSHI
jgi:hypothetical protein